MYSVIKVWESITIYECLVVACKNSCVTVFYEHLKNMYNIKRLENPTRYLEWRIKIQPYGDVTLYFARGRYNNIKWKEETVH